MISHFVNYFVFSLRDQGERKAKEPEEHSPQRPKKKKCTQQRSTKDEISLGGNQVGSS